MFVQCCWTTQWCDLIECWGELTPGTSKLLQLLGKLELSTLCTWQISNLVKTENKVFPLLIPSDQVDVSWSALPLSASWFLLYLFFCYHISRLVFVCSWPLSGLIQIWPFLLGSMSLYCSLFWNVTRLDFWIGSSHAALHFFHNEKKKRIVYPQFICKTTFTFQHVRHVRAQCTFLIWEQQLFKSWCMHACNTVTGMSE